MAMVSERTMIASMSAFHDSVARQLESCDDTVTAPLTCCGLMQSTRLRLSLVMGIEHGDSVDSV